MGREFNVYHCFDPDDPKRARYMGCVKAENAPAALGLAWERWPHLPSHGRVQRGIFVRDALAEAEGVMNRMLDRGSL